MRQQQRRHLWRVRDICLHSINTNNINVMFPIEKDQQHLYAFHLVCFVRFTNECRYMCIVHAYTAYDSTYVREKGSFPGHHHIFYSETDEADIYICTCVDGFEKICVCELKFRSSTFFSVIFE